MTRAPKGTFEGVWTALVTPFTATGEIDWALFETLLTEQAEGGVNGVVICGTTGESPALTTQEKLALVRKARAHLPEKVQVMAGTGSSNTPQSVELSKLAEDAGADSLLVVTPPYNKPSLAGLTLHFEAIAKAVRLPICLYHVPGRTAQFLTVAHLCHLTAIEGIEAVKEATGDVAYFSRALMGGTVPFLTGDDPTYLASMAVGGSGVISVVSNPFPKEMVALYRAFLDGKLAEAKRLHEIMLPMIDVLFCEANPGPAKAILRLRNQGTGAVRPPLAAVSEESFAKIRTVYEATLKALQ